MARLIKQRTHSPLRDSALLLCLAEFDQAWSPVELCDGRIYAHRERPIRPLLEVLMQVPPVEQRAPGHCSHLHGAVRASVQAVISVHCIWFIRAGTKDGPIRGYPERSTCMQPPITMDIMLKLYTDA